MLEYERPRLFAMTLSARLIETCHGQPSPRLHDVAPVRIVALHAIHAPFHDGMMLGKIELSMRFEMAVEANRGILARIDDGLACVRET